MKEPRSNLLTDVSKKSLPDGLVAVPLKSLVSAIKAKAVQSAAPGHDPRQSPVVTAEGLSQAWNETRAQTRGRKARGSPTPPAPPAAPAVPAAAAGTLAAASPPGGPPAVTVPAPPVPTPVPGSVPGSATAADSLHDHPLLALPTPSRVRLDGETYKTDLHLHLQGTFAPQGSLLLTLDHQINVQLQLIQFLMLFVLASHARTRAGLPSPLELPSGRFVSPKRLVEIIRSKIKPGERGLDGLFDNLTPDQLSNPKCVLLARLAAHGVSRDLLEWVRGSGWRISTPPSRIRITLIDPEDGDQTWG